MRIAHSLISRLQPGSNFGIPLSRMGSIADNGSWKIYAYRMSRATVNAGTKSLTIDWKPNGIAVAILHPGYFRTGSYQTFCCLLFLDISNWKNSWYSLNIETQNIHLDMTSGNGNIEVTRCVTSLVARMDGVIMKSCDGEVIPWWISPNSAALRQIALYYIIFNSANDCIRNQWIFSQNTILMQQTQILDWMSFWQSNKQRNGIRSYIIL